jgi:hypothetical protein
VVIVLTGLKLVKAVAGLEKSDFGVHLQHASMTPRNTEYPKYDPLGAQNSCDVLAKGIFCTLLPFSQNVRCK